MKKLFILISLLVPVYLMAQITCPPSITYEGTTYPVVKVGEQCWMAKNLNVGTMIPATQNQTNNNTIEKYCYKNIDANCESLGGIYQWNEMMQYVTTEKAKGICPEGWHIPTKGEWELLTYYSLGSTNKENYIKTSRDFYNSASVKLKGTEKAIMLNGQPFVWKWDYKASDMYNNTSLTPTNETGMDMMPNSTTSGTLNMFTYPTRYSWHWSSTQYAPKPVYGGVNVAWAFQLLYNQSVFWGMENFATSGMAVRCIMDGSADTPPAPPTK